MLFKTQFQFQGPWAWLLVHSGTARMGGHYLQCIWKEGCFHRNGTKCTMNWVYPCACMWSTHTHLMELFRNTFLLTAALWTAGPCTFHTHGILNCASSRRFWQSLESDRSLLARSTCAEVQLLNSPIFRINLPLSVCVHVCICFGPQFKGEAEKHLILGAQLSRWCKPLTGTVEHLICICPVSPSEPLSSWPWWEEAST